MCLNCLLDTDDKLHRSVLSVLASVFTRICLCPHLSVPTSVWQDLRHSQKFIEPEQGQLQVLTSDPNWDTLHKE